MNLSAPSKRLATNFVSDLLTPVRIRRLSAGQLGRRCADEKVILFTQAAPPSQWSVVEVVASCVSSRDSGRFANEPSFRLYTFANSTCPS